MSKFPITLEGYQKILKEIKGLKQFERPSIIKVISEARELGDLSENAEYHSAKERQSMIEGKILDLEDKVARAEIIDTSKIFSDSVKFGATISVRDEDTAKISTYSIVGDYEADIGKKLLSISSPIAKALIGKKVGDVVEVNTPKGDKLYTIAKIEYEKINL